MSDRLSSCDRMSTADLSEAESDTSSVMGDSMDSSSVRAQTPSTREQMQKRIDSLVQENRVLKMELETYKLRVKTLQEENKTLKQASVLIQAKAEQEEEFISNTLLKKIQELKKEKETLALNYEQEEECLTNDLSRKLYQLRQEKAELAQTLQQEQESLVNRLLRKIKKLESETGAKQANLEQLRREKVQLENTLEQEQEALVNRLWKRMEKLEGEKRSLQEKMDQPVSAPPSPMDAIGANGGSEPRSNDPKTLTKCIDQLRGEVKQLKQQLYVSEAAHCNKTAQLAKEEQQIREENLRLQQKLQMEVERRQQLCRHLSESESSLEVEDERHFNELISSAGQLVAPNIRSRAISSPVSAVAGTATGRVSPALGSKKLPSPFDLNVNVNLPSGCVPFGAPSPIGPLHVRCPTCGTLFGPPTTLLAGTGSQSTILTHASTPIGRTSSGGIEKPPIPPTCSSPSPRSRATHTSVPESKSYDGFVKPTMPPPTRSGSNSPAGIVHPTGAVCSAEGGTEQQSSSNPTKTD